MFDIFVRANDQRTQRTSHSLAEASANQIKVLRICLHIDAEVNCCIPAPCSIKMESQLLLLEDLLDLRDVVETQNTPGAHVVRGLKRQANDRGDVIVFNSRKSAFNSWQGDSAVGFIWEANGESADECGHAAALVVSVVGQVADHERASLRLRDYHRADDIRHCATGNEQRVFFPEHFCYVALKGFGGGTVIKDIVSGFRMSHCISHLW